MMYQPRYRAYLASLTDEERAEEGASSSNHRFINFIRRELAQFRESEGLHRGASLTDEQHKLFTNYLLEKHGYGAA